MSYDINRLSQLHDKYYVYDALDSETLDILLQPDYFDGVANESIVIVNGDKVVNKITLTINAVGTASVAG